MNADRFLEISALDINDVKRVVKEAVNLSSEVKAKQDRETKGCFLL